MRIEKPRGVRDFLPGDMVERNFVKNSITGVFRSFGFEEIQTPTIEYSDIFTLKSGEEIRDTMYVFMDKGGRELCLKPEETASVCRFYTERFQDHVLPLKFFYFCPIFRYDEPQKGRYREFYHLGVELFGSSMPESDAEIISLAFNSLKNLGMKFSLKVNNLKIIKSFLKALNLSEENNAKILHFIDKNENENLKEISGKVMSEREKEIFLDLIEKRGSRGIIEDLYSLLNDYPEAVDGLRELESVFCFLDCMNVEYEMDMRTVRGLDYYTGTVFEIFAEGMQICGGGRYDNLIGLFSGKDVPSVGFAFGFERVIEAAKSQGIKFETKKDKTIIAPTKNELKKDALKIALDLRNAGINAEIDLMGRSFRKILEYANKADAEYLIIVGEKEIQENTVGIKNMKTGSQELIKIDEILNYFNKQGL